MTPIDFSSDQMNEFNPLITHHFQKKVTLPWINILPIISCRRINPDIPYRNSRLLEWEKFSRGFFSEKKVKHYGSLTGVFVKNIRG